MLQHRSNATSKNRRRAGVIIGPSSAAPRPRRFFCFDGFADTRTPNQPFGSNVIAARLLAFQPGSLAACQPTMASGTASVLAK